MQLWEIENQAKVLQDVIPDESDIARTWSDIDSGVKGIRPGNGLYSPSNQSYLLIADYQLLGKVHWVRATHTWFLD